RSCDLLRHGCAMGAECHWRVIGLVWSQGAKFARTFCDCGSRLSRTTHLAQFVRGKRAFRGNEPPIPPMSKRSCLSFEFAHIDVEKVVGRRHVAHDFRIGFVEFALELVLHRRVPPLDDDLVLAGRNATAIDQYHTWHRIQYRSTDRPNRFSASLSRT